MKLFNSYCMAWYGSQMWDLSGAHIQKMRTIGTKLLGRYGICHIGLIVVCCHI